MSAELSAVQRCRKNKWKKGTVLKCTEFELGNRHYEYWMITAFGRQEVLGIRVKLPAYTVTSETVIPFNNRDSWRLYAKEQRIRDYCYSS